MQSTERNEFSSNYFAPGGSVFKKTENFRKKPLLKRLFVRAGYILSRSTVSMVGNDVLRRSGGWNRCSTLYGRLASDVALAHCLRDAGVLLSDSRDSQERQRFHMFDAPEMFDFNGFASLFAFGAFD